MSVVCTVCPISDAPIPRVLSKQRKFPSLAWALALSSRSSGVQSRSPIAACEVTRLMRQKQVMMTRRRQLEAHRTRPDRSVHVRCIQHLTPACHRSVALQRLVRTTNLGDGHLWPSQPLRQEQEQEQEQARLVASCRSYHIAASPPSISACRVAFPCAWQ